MNFNFTYKNSESKLNYLASFENNHSYTNTTLLNSFQPFFTKFSFKVIVSQL